MVLPLDRAADPIQFQCWLTKETNIKKKTSKQQKMDRTQDQGNVDRIELLTGV